MSKFAAGQVWTYHTRADEDDSRVRVLRVDDSKPAGVIVHVAVDGVAIFNPADPNRPTQSIGFMPISEGALEASVIELVTEDPTFVPSTDFAEGYAGWKDAFDAGKAGFWTAPVANIVQTIDDGMRRT